MSLLFCSASSIARLSVSTIGATVPEACGFASCAPARAENIASMAPPTAAIRNLFTIARLPQRHEFPLQDFYFKIFVTRIATTPPAPGSPPGSPASTRRKAPWNTRLRKLRSHLEETPERADSPAERTGPSPGWQCPVE